MKKIGIIAVLVMGLSGCEYITSQDTEASGKLEVSKTFSFPAQSGKPVTIPAGTYPQSTIKLVDDEGHIIGNKKSFRISLGDDQGHSIVIKPSLDFKNYRFQIPENFNQSEVSEEISFQQFPGTQLEAQGHYNKSSAYSNEITETRECSIEVDGGSSCGTAYVPGDCSDVSDGHGGSSQQCDPAQFKQVCTEAPSTWLKGHHSLTYKNYTVTENIELQLKDTVTGKDVTTLKFRTSQTSEIPVKGTDCAQNN